MTRQEAQQEAIRIGLENVGFGYPVYSAIKAVENTTGFEFTPEEKQEIRTRILEKWNAQRKEGEK
jgi:hypothetical protein